MARLFIATDIAVSVVERLIVLQQHLDAVTPGAVRWVEPTNVHATLKFLGEVDEALIPIVSDELRRLVQPLFPFEVTCCRIGGFPDLSDPQVLWAGLDPTGAEVMGLLHQTIEQTLAELGLAADPRPFHPHITLGRVRRGDVTELLRAAQQFAGTDFGVSYVKDLVLFESVRSSEGARYLVRERFSLGE